MRRTKIVATVGPASNSEEKLEELVEAGADVLRFNFSHSTHEEHGKVFDRVKKLGLDVATMLDTKGPEHRVGDFGETFVEDGDTLCLGNGGDCIPVRYDALIEHADEGDKILVNDGDVELLVVGSDENSITCEVVFGGLISSGDSINVPGKDLGLTAPTEKDLEDIVFGSEKGFDVLSVSFVKSAEDVREIRSVLEKYGSEMDIISKIEHVKAVENLEEIVEASDGIMVARGDLGVETSASSLPLLQKKIIRMCNEEAIPVITATQMLKSMAESPRATRAETSDVANAVLDGTDAVMLSEESAVGKYPVKSVEYMSEVVKDVESQVSDYLYHMKGNVAGSVTDAVCKSVYKSADEMGAEYIVAHTSSGYTARNVAKFRPSTPIIAFTDSETVCRQLKLVWGVKPVFTEFADDFQDMIVEAGLSIGEEGLVSGDDLMVFTAGVPESIPGNTNIMEIRRFSELLEESEVR